MRRIVILTLLLELAYPASADAHPILRHGAPNHRVTRSTSLNSAGYAATGSTFPQRVGYLEAAVRRVHVDERVLQFLGRFGRGWLQYGGADRCRLGLQRRHATVLRLV
jgi:hypothetical protein